MRRVGWTWVCIFSFLIARSQDLSNKGRDFWITYPAHVDGNLSTLGIYITSDVDASGMVQGAGISIPFSITANTVKRVFVGPGGDAANTNVYLAQLDGIANNAALHVTSDKPVVVYSHIIHQARSGATLILPTAVWGKEYIVPSYQNFGISGGGATSGIPAITVVAKDTNTVIEITPKVQSFNGTRVAGTPYTITLAKPGDVYQVQYVANSDISGTTVRSVATTNSTCKPIGVFSSTTWSAFDCGPTASGGDNLYQQLFPVRSFGKSFLTAPFINRNYDIIRVFVTDPATIVSRKENGVTTTLSGLVANSFYEFKTNLPNSIVADKPVCVIQYITSQSCYPQNPVVYLADPEMVILSPVEQTINNITVFSAHQNFVPVGQSNVNKCYLNIIMKSVGVPGFKINGSIPKSSFIVIPGTGYSYLQEDVSVLSSTNPVQTLSADSNFSAIAYGYGDRESYGYNAGTNLRDLYQFITLKNKLATVNYPATCVNAPLQFYITLPYSATKLVWHFKGQFPDVTIANPVPDSTYQKDDKTLYQFRLPNNFSFPNSGTFPITVVATNASSDGCAGEQDIDYEVQVNERPKAKFVWQHTGCVADPVKFFDSTNALGYTVNRWSWDFGDNTKDIVKQPVKLFTVPGNYVVKESIVTDMGCIADTTEIISITTQPVALFTSIGAQCTGSKIPFKDASTITAGVISKWFWDYGNGKKDTLLTNSVPTVIYQPGTYTVSLTVQSNSGCTSNPFSQVLNVTENPSVDFKLPLAVCLPKGEAAFFNQSTIVGIATNPLTYLWNFGDGITDTATNPVHFYKSAVPFSIKLIVTSKAGCIKDTTKIFNTILTQPIAAFNLNNSICLKDSSSFIDASTAVNQNIIKYYWDRGDGTIDSSRNQYFIYQSAGTFNIKHWVVSDKGCNSDTLLKQQVVNLLPLASFDVSAALCQGQLATFKSTSSSSSGTINRFLWNMGDGTSKDLNNANPFNYSYSSLGPKSVSLVVTATTGCVSDTFTKQVQVFTLPVANFGLPEICVNDAIAQFTDSSYWQGGGTLIYLWRFGDPNASASNPDTSIVKDASHKYSASANYQVKLQVTTKDGCSQTATKTLTVNGNSPVSNFTILNNDLCSNELVTITNKSTVNFGNITKLEIFWNWPSLADITIDTIPVAGKNYFFSYFPFSTPATKLVSIRVVAYSGSTCSNEMIKIITLHAIPIIVFQPFTGNCPTGQSIQLTQASVLGNIIGSGIYTGPGVSPPATFNPASVGPGIYSLTYIFKSAVGCSDTATQNITVWPAPKAIFGTSSPICDNNAITITDTSSAGFGKIKTWNWTFGDGTTSLNNSGNPVTKTYPTGSYGIQLQVTTDSGCVSTITTKNILVNPLPVVDFDLPASACVNTVAKFINRSTIPDNSSSQFTYAWQFAPGLTSNAKDPMVSFPNSGDYNIGLQVTSKDGCISSAIKILNNVLPQPMASFVISRQQVCAGDTVSFNDVSNPLSQTISSWSWNFNDGSISSLQNPVHIFRNEGNYSVSLFYSTNIGCNSDTVSKPVDIFPVPIVNAGPDLVILRGAQKTIFASATGGSNFQYQWKPATALNNPFILQPTTSTSSDILYTLTVTSQGGCSASDDMMVKFLEDPVIPTAFSPNSDGINDIWNIKYIENYAGSTISVFDRYGRQVYNGYGTNRPWDGKINGVPVPVGVYYYIIDLKIGKPPITGSVTILR